MIRRGLPDRQGIIDNFIKVHTIDRLGQILDSLDYRNLKFERKQFSENLIEKLENEQPEDVLITSTHVFFKRVYAARRIIPVNEFVRTAGKQEVRRVLLSVGWNIKHLAAMGFLPKSLGLEHFGLTSWGRVVYLDNASLVDIRMFRFRGHQGAALGWNDIVLTRLPLSRISKFHSRTGTYFAQSMEIFFRRIFGRT